MITKNILLQLTMQYRMRAVKTFFNSKIGQQHFYQMASIKAQRKKTFYQILQVPSTAPQASIRKNFLKLAKIYHPDVYKGSDKNRFESIQNAYQTLSNVRKRKQYDVEIGIKKAPSHQDQARGTKYTATSASEQQINSKNTFTYQKTVAENNDAASEIDIDAEYEKFFRKKKQTDFEEIRLHEQRQFMQMSQKQRIRFRFKELYSEGLAQQKIHNQLAFQEMLDDQINQRNTHHEDIQKKKQRIEKLNSEKWIRVQKIGIYALALLFPLMLYPLLLSFITKRRLQREQKELVQKMIKRVQRKKEQCEIRSRFQY